MEEEVAKHQFSLVLCIFHPPCFPPKSPTQSAGPRPKTHKPPLEIDQNFDHFLTSFWDRFWVVLRRQVGVIFGTLGGQDGPRSIQNASWKPISIQNVIFYQTHARVYRSVILEPKMASKMPQDRPKTAPRGSWRAYFSLLQIVSNFDSFWAPIWSIWGSQIPPKKLGGRPPLLHLESVRFSRCVVLCFKVAQEQPKRPQDPTKSAPRGSKRPPRAPQEAPRGPQETPRCGQEGSRPSKIDPRGSKRHRRRFRSPKSTYPKGLAPNHRMKKGGRAAVIPLGEVNKILKFPHVSTWIPDFRSFQPVLGRLVHVESEFADKFAGFWRPGVKI